MDRAFCTIWFVLKDYATKATECCTSVVAVAQDVVAVVQVVVAVVQVVD